MPVAGLPVPLETVLTCLLATHETSSWKVTGESGAIAVVLRFREYDGRPLPQCNVKRGAWKRKTPSQRRRDQRRAAEHRAKGELTAVPTLLPSNFEKNVFATPAVSDDAAARVSCATTEADHAAYSSVTFDPASAPVHSEMQPTSDVTVQEPLLTTTPPPTQIHQPELPSPPAGIDTSSEDSRALFQQKLADFEETMKRGMAKIESSLDEGVARVRSALNFNDSSQTDRDWFPPPMNHTTTDLPFACGRIGLKSPSKSSPVATATTPRAPDWTHSNRDMFVNTSRPVTRPTPPTRQLSTRSAREK